MGLVSRYFRTFTGAFFAVCFHSSSGAAGGSSMTSQRMAIRLLPRLKIVIRSSGCSCGARNGRTFIFFFITLTFPHLGTLALARLRGWRVNDTHTLVGLLKASVGSSF
jgi:hypothetical protein